MLSPLSEASPFVAAGADGASGFNPGPVVKHQWAITGTSGAGDTDQTPFYNVPADVAKDANHNLVVPALTSSTRYNAATAARYIADRPSSVANLHFTGASVDDLYDDCTIDFVTQTPQGSNGGDTLDLSGYRTAGQFQRTVLDVALDNFALDGYAYFRVNSPGAASPNSYRLGVALRESLDPRAIAPVGPPLAVRD